MGTENIIAKFNFANLRILLRLSAFGIFATSHSVPFITRFCTFRIFSNEKWQFTLFSSGCVRTSWKTFRMELEHFFFLFSAVDWRSFFLSKINYVPLYSNALLLKIISTDRKMYLFAIWTPSFLLFHFIWNFYAFGMLMVRCGLTGMLLIMSRYVNLEFSTHSRCKCNKLNCFISRLLTRPSTFESLRTFELFDRIICNPIEMEFHSIAMNRNEMKRNETKRNKNRSNLFDFCSLQKFKQITSIF